MTVNTGTKRYWGRTGPDSIFDLSWMERKNASNEEAEALFDGAWKRSIQKAVESGRVVSTETARGMMPDDKRADHFRPWEEHREFVLDGQIHLAQIDPKRNELTQMWHLKGRRKADDGPPLRDNEIVPKLNCRLEQMNRDELVTVISEASALLQKRLQLA